MENNNYLLDYFHCTKNCHVVKQISVTDWFNLIKSGVYSNDIVKARNGESNYDEVKTNVLPCVVYNFNFKKYKTSKNIDRATGLMYIDIDAPDFQIENVDKNKVFAYYKSFGGNGYSIIVRVDGLSEDNFEDTYFYVCSDLGILDYIDLGAKKTTQFNVVSYDTELYINSNSKIFKSIINTPLSKTREEKRAYSRQGGVNSSNVRFDNKEDYLKNKQSVFKDLNGFDFIEAKLLYKKVEKNRNNILLSYCTNLVWLNPNIFKDRLFSIMMAVNHHNFVNPVDSEQVQRIINSVLKYKNDGTLQPLKVKKRKIVFGSNCGLTKNEKLALCREVSSESRAKRTHEKFRSILDNWDFKLMGKISQNSIIKNNSISKKTVEKYYKHYKKEIEILNNTCKL